MCHSRSLPNLANIGESWGKIGPIWAWSNSADGVVFSKLAEKRPKIAQWWAKNDPNRSQFRPISAEVGQTTAKIGLNPSKFGCPAELGTAPANFGPKLGQI